MTMIALLGAHVAEWSARNPEVILGGLPVVIIAVLVYGQREIWS